MSAPGRVAIVSGGSRGLGAGLVEALLRDGYRVATFSRASTPFIETHSANADAFYWRSIDGSDFAALRGLVRDLSRRWGPVHTLINNMAAGTDGLLSLTSEAAIGRTIAVNLEAAVHLTRACLKAMIAEQTGSIINISSVNARRGHAGVSVYSATKAALDGLTRSLAREAGPEGIRVNSVAPGFFDSEMTAGLGEDVRARILRRIPLRRMGRIEDIVGLIRFLLSDAGSYIHGEVIAVDGGMSC